MKVADLAGLAAWALVAGVPAFLVLHFNLAADSRVKVMRWCISAGLFSFVVLAADSFPFGPTVSRATMGAGFVGLPAFIVGELLALVPARPRRSVQAYRTPKD